MSPAKQPIAKDGSPVVLISGASSGIGRAIASEFASRGARLVLVARRAPDLAAAAEHLLAAGAAAALAVPGDVGDSSVFLKAAEVACERFGGLDAAIFNTGGPPEGRLTTVSDEAWQRAFQEHVLGPVRLIRACREPMHRKGGGRIVLVSSVAARQPIEGLAVSSVLRSALLGLVKTASRELGPDRIAVNAVLPGFTATERLQDVMRSVAESSNRTADDVAAQWAAAIPAGRIASPSEIARVVAFLAGPDASYVNGVSLAADGGWTAGI